VDDIVWKAIRRFQGELWSFLPGELAVRYGPDIVTRGKYGTPVLAFQRYDQVIRFVTEYCLATTEIWRCVADVIEPMETLAPSWKCNVQEIVDWWTYRPIGSWAPVGTVACRTLHPQVLVATARVNEIHGWVEIKEVSQC
jgi:hypothetical protein